MKRTVERHRRKRSAWEREVSDQVDVLTQENMRLAQEVRRKGEEERKLVHVRSDVNSELSERQGNVQEHCDKIEQLNKDILEINSVKNGLEREIETLSKTVQSLTSSVNHSNAKEKALERKIKLQDHTLQELEKDCERMRSYNLQVFFSEPSHKRQTCKHENLFCRYWVDWRKFPRVFSPRGLEQKMVAVQLSCKKLSLLFLRVDSEVRHG